MERAQLTTGLIAGSALVGVSAPSAADGTVVLVHSGNALLGQATLTAGQASVTLTRGLVPNEVLVASLGEAGNQTGIPIIVAESGVVINGWRTPSEVSVTDTDTGETLNLTAAQFKRRYGYLPASAEDPAGLQPSTWPEYAPADTGGIGFDLVVERTAGQTVVTVTAITGIRGAALVSWAGSAYANALSKTYSEATSVLISVKGSGNTDPEAVSKTYAVTIQPPASSGSGSNTDSRLAGIIWRDFGNNTVRVEANGATDMQVRLRATDGWVDMTNYAPQYYEALFTGIGSGVYNAQLRVSGETDSTKWKAWTFTKQ